MSEERDVQIAVVGGGMAGLTAAYTLRERDVVLLEREPTVGGRMYSERDSEGGWWGNYGAQMITGERVTVVDLAEQVGCALTPVRWAHVLERARVAFQGMRVGGGAAEQLQETIRRLEAEQTDRRPADHESLDLVSFGDWLGHVQPAVREFWEDWSQGLANAAVDEISLYAAMCLWGEQRVTPWVADEIPRHALGDCVVDGGTVQLGLAIGRTLGDRVLTATEVHATERSGGRYVIEARGPQGELRLRAEQLVFAVPAPVVLRLAPWLPPAKRAALGAVKYGRFLATPIWVMPANRPTPWTSTALFRPDATYALPAFPLRTPGDVDREGGCYQSWVNDRDAGAIWNDSDESIQAGARAAFLSRFPEYADRISHIGVRRWEYGLPKLAPGRMADMTELTVAVDGVHFCGDYTHVANLEGSATSGLRVAQELATTT